MAEFVTAREAADKIADNSTIGTCGMGLAGWPEEVAAAIETRFDETGHPQNIKLKQGSFIGDGQMKGVVHFAKEGLISSWTTSIIGLSRPLAKMAEANMIECYCLPQGVTVNLWREIGAKRPGLITKVGLGTYVDPRIEGAKMNDACKEDIVELIEFSGEEYLFYKGFPLHVALLRGTTADEDGNITFEKEGIVNEGLALAQAAKASGGIVIAQVEYIAKRGTLYAKDVRIPGALIDYVVVATTQDACWQTEHTLYEPSFAGALKTPVDRIPPLPLDIRKVIARRAAMELHAGDLINLGVGIPASISGVVAEEGFDGHLTFSVEAGAIGGVPAPMPNFGSAYNPQAFIDHGAMFDLIDGGMLDLTCLGLAQVDKEGNLNVSKFGSRINGPGGFINLTCASKKVVFCGTFMNGAKIEVKDGKLTILEEGQVSKFVDKVDQITFSGAQAANRAQDVTYVTERAVFKLTTEGLELIEIAPGIDLDRDIVAEMGFMPIISAELKEMDSALFCDVWGKLGETLL